MKLLSLRKVYGPEPDMNPDQQIRVHQKRPDPKVDSDTRCLPLFFFLYDSNPSALVIHMLKHFRIWFQTRRDMYLRFQKLCCVLDTEESNMLYLHF